MRPQATAILCLSDVLALGALFELQRRKISIPKDMALIGIDGLPSSASAFPSITTVQLPSVEMGTRTANAVAEWVEHQVVPESYLIDTALIVREST